MSVPKFRLGAVGSWVLAFFWFFVELCVRTSLPPGQLDDPNMFDAQGQLSSSPNEKRFRNNHARMKNFA
jgi:hypothetical protein